MRSQQQMMDLILEIARKDNRVRAVAMNGSRTNPAVPKDIFQDYDVVYLVTEMESFLNDPGWVDVFGERVIMQTPEAMTLLPPSLGGRFTYLMQFEDGNRIDLCLVLMEEKDQYCKEDRLTVVLLDKDGVMPKLEPPDDRDYHVKRPNEKLFLDCCNEFWWVMTYVAKGIWRKEMPYAMDMLNHPVRDMLNCMMSWHIGTKTDFSVSVGKSCKYFQRYLDPQMWDSYAKTYPAGNYQSLWDSVYEMCTLFRRGGEWVADFFGFSYPVNEEQKVIRYLKHVEHLPENAKEF